MVQRVARVLLRLVVAAGVLWLAREGLKRWVDGPTEHSPPGPWPEPPPAPGPATVVATADAWVVPGTEGEAPASHPVKAKLSSRLYHLPGMAAYARTKPDRCYSSAEAAEADGFVRAKH